jgi:hypothetical protein
MLKEFCLSEDFDIFNVQLKKDTWVFFDDEFQLTCVFPQETGIQRYKCKGGGGKKGIQTSFYSNGKLKSFFASGDLEINNVFCTGGVLNYIRLKRDGSLSRCKLAKKQEINGVLYKENTILNFVKNGKIIN